MSMEIRRYRSADRGAVWELHNLAWLVEQRMVAMGALRRLSSCRTEIKRNAGPPRAAERRGLGVQMPRALEERASTRGIASLVLETTAGQTAARSLYTGRGYHQTGRMRQGRFEVLRYKKWGPFVWR